MLYVHMQVKVILERIHNILNLFQCVSTLFRWKETVALQDAMDYAEGHILEPIWILGVQTRTHVHVNICASDIYL